MKPFLYFFVLAFLFSSQNSFAQYSGGNGTSGSPYQIANASDLSTLSSTPADWNKNFIQTALIDLEFQPNHSPIGTSATPFTGNYDGNNQTIRAMTVSETTDYTGMFGYVSGSEIKDLQLTVLNVTGGDDYVGGLAGYATSATITNIDIYGDVNGKYNLGGMIGEANNCTFSECASQEVDVTSSGGDDSGSNIGGLIGLLSTTGTGSMSDCSSSGTVTADGAEDVGGLIGESQLGMSDCSSSSDVTAVDYVGGLIGYADGGTIENSYSEGNVEGDEYVGGLIGDADGCTINSCSSTAAVSVDGDDEDYIGGLIGRADDCNFNICFYAMNSVTGDDYTGGLIGYALNGCDINNSFCIMATVNGYHNTGGFIGENDASSVSNSYSTAAVNAEGDNVGGFIGVNDDSDGTPEVTECYSTGNVNGTDSDSDDTGGFIGENWGLVENCYSTGDVSNSGGSSGWFAAFIGNNKDEGNVRYCYTTGDYTTATGGDKGFIHPDSENTNGTSNFFESSQTSGAGATKKTNNQMTNATTFLTASWDFTTSSSEWAMNQDENNGYPFLRFQITDPFFPLSPSHIWLGSAKSTSWNTSGNWSENTLPTTSNNIIIPDVANNVVITSGVGANSNKLKVESNAILTMNPGGSLITDGSITNNGTINIEQTITDSKWHYISSPITNATSQLFFGDYLQYWTENGLIWTDIGPTNHPLTPTQGFSLWGTPDKGNYTFTGTPNTGEKSIQLSYHPDQDPEKESEGFNLVGNPYPSSIDWSLLQASYGTAYVWNPNTENYIYNTNSDIAPMQGFFIYTTNNGSNFTINDNHRSHGGTFYKNEKNITNGLMLHASYGDHHDEWILEFDDSADEHFNLVHDSWKLLSNGENVSQIWSYSPDGKLSIDKRAETNMIQLGFRNPTNGYYYIKLSENNGLTAELEDTKLNLFHDLERGDYYFNWNTSDSEERFILHLKATGTEDLEASELAIYSLDGRVYIRQNETNSWKEARVYDLAGRVVYETPLNTEMLQSFELNQPIGAYLVQLMGEKSSLTEKVILE